MKSPITGKEMLLMRELRSMTFRKEEFEVVFHFYKCDETGEQFTTTELDKINLRQLYNQYRDSHNLPFPEQVRETRVKYGLNATKMSEVLGFGVNSYRNYENDEVPVLANGRLIQLADDPEKFRDLVILSEQIDEADKKKIIIKIEAIINEINQNKISLQVENYLVDGRLADEYTGYKKPSFGKLAEMIVYFTDKLQPWKTQLNKLLFYADFLHFKRHCISISGTRYRAIEMGPVPYNYDSIFEYLANNNIVSIKQTEFPNGAIGEQFKLNPNRPLISDNFTEEELSVLDFIANYFSNTSANQIINTSHNEKGWKENCSGRKIISYKYAFDLKI